MIIMIVIVIGLLRTNVSGLYRHRRGLGFTWSRLQERNYDIRIAKLVFHAKESPIRTRVGVLSLVSSRSNSPDDAYSPVVWIPPNPGLPQASFSKFILCLHKEGLMPLRPSRVYPIAAWCFFRVFSNLSSSCSDRLALIITGYIFFSSR